MKGYIILSQSIDIPTAEDDGVLEAVRTGLASEKVYTDIKQAKTEVATMTWNLVEEVKADNEDLDEDDQIAIEVEETETETFVKTYFQGDLLNMLTYSIMEVEL